MSLERQKALGGIGGRREEKRADGRWVQVKREAVRRSKVDGAKADHLGVHALQLAVALGVVAGGGDATAKGNVVKKGWFTLGQLLDTGAFEQVRELAAPVSEEQGDGDEGELADHGAENAGDLRARLVLEAAHESVAAVHVHACEVLNLVVAEAIDAPEVEGADGGDGVSGARAVHPALVESA